MNYTEIVNKLIGKITPIGESNTDKERFDNLTAMCGLVNNLIIQIHSVAVVNKDSHEASRKKAGIYAEDFLKEIIVTTE